VCMEGCMHSGREFFYWLMDNGLQITAEPDQQPSGVNGSKEN